MSQENPMKNIYMTTEEFTDLLVEILEDSNYFKRGVKAHPEDILFALVPAAEAVVASFKHFGRKLTYEMAAEKNSEFVANYSEDKYGKIRSN